jgi:dTDP-4-dehydrorhamnose 3,5-epimerase
LKVTELEVPGVLLIEPQVFRDPRGFFVETFSRERYADAGVGDSFVQDNLSRSVRGVLRGLHVQNPVAQAKLVSVPVGAVFDVAVDLRIDSPSFGKWVGRELSEENQHQLYVPLGCAHGFVVLSDVAVFSYKCSDVYSPQTQFGVAYDDPDIGIEWPLSNVILSEKDRSLPRLRDVSRDRLMRFQPRD